MKIKNIIALALIGGVALTGCDYNADNFEGLDEKIELTDVQTLEYTLTDSDYTTLSEKASSISSANAAALKAVGTAKAFSAENPASELIPYYLAYNGGRFYTLSDGSSIKVTYNNRVDAPEIITAMSAATGYTLSDDDYKAVWGSDKDYVSTLTPATVNKLSKVIPSEGIEAGSYVAVTYNYAASEPQFDAPEPPAFKKVTSFAGAGEYMIVAIGDGNFAMTPLAADKKYGYPGKTEVAITDGAIAAAAADGLLWTVEATDKAGEYTLKGADERYYYQSGSYNSFNVTDTAGSEGYAFTFTANGDGTFTIKNVAVNKWLQYDPTYSSFGSYGEEKGILPTLFAQDKSEKASVKAVTPASEKRYAIFKWDGTSFSAADAVVLQHADYAAMGQSHDNLSTNNADLTAYLKLNFPYAQVDDVKNLVYAYYNSADKTTSWVAVQYAFDGASWIKNDNIEQVTDQFVRQNGAWVYNPSVVITLNPGKGQALSAQYFQAMTDWVWENVDQKLGAEKKGSHFVTSYGNNEYYTGASAYQGNIDLRPGSARSQYGEESYQGSELVEAGVAFSGDGYNSLGDEQVIELMTKRVQYVMGKVLSQFHPDAKPIDGIEVTYTVNFGIYQGFTISSCTHQIVYKVVGPAEFEFVEMSEL